MAHDFNRRVDELEAQMKSGGLKSAKDTVLLCPDCLSVDLDPIVDSFFIGEGVALPTTEMACNECGFEGIPIEMPLSEYKKIEKQLK